MSGLWARLAGSLLAIILIFGFVVDFGAFSRALNAVRLWDLMWLGLAVVLVLGIGACRWYLLLRALRFRRRFGEVARAFLLGNGLNVVIPSGMVGEIAKAYLVSEPPPRPASRALGAIVVDRLIGLAGLLVALGATLIIGGLAKEHPVGVEVAIRPTWGLAVLALGLGPVALLYLDRKLPRSAKWWRVKLTSLVLVLKTIVEFREHIGTLLVVLALAVVGHFAITVAIWNLTQTFGPTPFQLVLLTVTLTFLVSLLPITINGLGTRELVFVVMLGLINIASEQSATISLTWFAASFVISVAAAALAGVGLPPGIRRSIPIGRRPFAADGTPLRGGPLR